MKRYIFFAFVFLIFSCSTSERNMPQSDVADKRAKEPDDAPKSDAGFELIRQHNVKQATRNGLTCLVWTNGLGTKYGAIGFGIRMTYEEKEMHAPRIHAIFKLRESRMGDSKVLRTEEQDANLQRLIFKSGYWAIQTDGSGNRKEERRDESDLTWEVMLEDPLKINVFGKTPLEPGNYLVDLEISCGDHRFTFCDLRFAVDRYYRPNKE